MGVYSVHKYIYIFTIISNLIAYIKDLVLQTFMCMQKSTSANTLSRIASLLISVKTFLSDLSLLLVFCA